jgi:hypothetical protein
MIESEKRVYIENCCGLCNRLEIFVLASAIQRAYGHQIVLGWPELDVLKIDGTRHGTPGLLGRWGAIRLRSCDIEAFAELAGCKNIILRGFGGPEEKMAPIYLETASKIKLRAPLAAAVSAFFRKIGPRPVVGIHLRQGDFPLLSEEVYDLNKALLSAVPLWWHEWVMNAILQRQPDVCFLVCQTQAEQAVATLRKNFEIAELPIGNPYQGTTGHQSSNHPVAELFALACCPVILATPVSSFSHYAANVLGGESICLMPPPQMKKGDRAIVRSHVHGKLLQHWVNASCHGWRTELPPASLEGVDLGQAARCGWLQAN